MTRRRLGASDPDRFITKRYGVYQYNRRVPKDVAHLDSRAPIVKRSLKTDDLALAREKRNLLERADNDLWAVLLLGDTPEDARQRYEATVKRAEIMGFAYMSSTELAATASTSEIIRRVRSLSGEQPGSHNEQAVLGLVDRPKDTVRQAFKIYCEEIKAPELITKSKVQKSDWKKVKQRAVSNFIALVGNKPIGEITREDAVKLYNHWGEKITSADADQRRSASSGNRDLGNLRDLFGAYHKHMGDHTIQNPFAGLSFSEKRKRSRPPFSVDWIKSKFLQPGGIQLLNIEARGIIFVMIETGARPSEICNLRAEHIILDHNVPHILVEPREDPDDPREIKTESSIRKIPLVGIALELMRRFPKGFPRYADKERTLSNTLNKTLRSHGLLQTAKHSAYSLRHSFEDRMKDAKFDVEMRKMLMGHTIDRPKYGEGGALEIKAEEMARIALPYDPVILRP